MLGLDHLLGVLSWAARCALVRLWVPVVTNDHPSTSLKYIPFFHHLFQ